VKRRQLSVWQRCELGERYLDIETERNRQKHEAQRNLITGQYEPLATNDSERSEHELKSLTKAAKKANVGYQTLRKI